MTTVSTDCSISLITLAFPDFSRFFQYSRWVVTQVSLN